MAVSERTLGIDFGTSNSAAGILLDGAPHLISVEGQGRTMPTSIFFDFEAQDTVFGAAANKAMIAGEEGRYMRALKSILGTSLMHEPRRMFGKSMTFVDIIAHFLMHLKAAAEAQTGRCFDQAISGRPVHFHSADPARDAQAVKDLRQCYERAGFKAVRFLYEPEAAALARGASTGISLIVDIGGGTSDFSLFRAGKDGIDILASNGVRVGGTDFDRAISMDRVMPLFGRGTNIRNLLGPGTLPAPVKIFRDLATWQMIPFLYTRDVRREVEEMRKLAERPDRLARLAGVLEHHLGHEVAFAVESGKIDANGNTPDARIDLGMVEPRLGVDINGQQMALILSEYAARIGHAAMATLDKAGLAPGDVDEVIHVGGSSLMAVVEDTMKAIFPDARMHRADAFTAVADGLAIASAEGI